jgi:exoribonuclease-2
MDPIGHLVEFIEKNRVILAMVQSAKKNRWGVLTAADRQMALPAGRSLHISPAAISHDRPRQALVEYLTEIDILREDLASQVDVPGLWELVHEEKDQVPLKDLAELQFGSEAAIDHQAAVLRALFYERLHFRLSGGDYAPLSAEKLEQKQVQQEREAAHREEVDQAVEYLRSIKASKAGQPDQPPSPELVKILTELLVLEDEAPQAKKAKEIVSLSEIGGKRQLFKMLIRLGAIPPHANLPLMKEGLPVVFEPRLEESARKISPAVALGPDRRDLSDLYTFTIDGLYTTDFDDALSFEPDEGGGGTLGVHITDAASLLQSGDDLDLEAMERATTLYMPDTRIPMLPPELSEDALSLRQDESRPGISCLVQVDAQGNVVDYEFVRSILKVHKRLTYDEADEMLQNGDARLKGLLAACDALRRKRGEAGAYFLPLPEVLVGVDEAFQVRVRLLNRDGQSREMVAETAILANTLVGRYLEDQGVTGLYRTQAEPREPIEEGDPDDLFLHFKQRRLLNPVEITTKPGKHSSLGVEYYTHATSPIRRYLDLVMQRQLAAVLAGKPPAYSQRELEEMAMCVQPNVRRAMRVRQARQRYWLLKWLDERRDEKHPALVMEYQTRRWQLLLTEVMMLTTIPNQPGLSLEPGQKVVVKIEKADAFFDQLRVSLLDDNPGA